ncbi:MAG: ABC transporter substrate-binding protein [Acidimicrobiaceae bacterium]|nr:ABC transporter substrate-binding protein [Acidimicrobiaceae bacterium]
MKRKYFAGSLAAIALLVTTVAPATATVGSRHTKPFVIALPVSLSGGNAQVGQEFLTGLKIWVDMVNNNTGLYAKRRAPKGLLGRKVKLIFDDDQSRSDEAGKLVTKYISQLRADFVFPPYGSGSTGVVASIFKQNNYALIGASAASESIYSAGFDNMVMAVSSSSKWFAALPDMVQTAGYKTVSIVTLNNPFTIDSERYLSKQFAGRKITVKGIESFSFGNKDFSAIWTKVKAQNPDVVILQAFGGDAVTAMKQAAELKISPKMWAVVAGAWRNDVFVSGVGAATADCVIGDQHWNSKLNTKGAKEFARAYAKKMGSNPLSGNAGSDGSAAWGFAGGQLLTEALDYLGEAGLKDQQKIVNFLKSGKVKETALGKFAVDRRTGINTATEPTLFQFQNGKRVTISPKSVMEAPVKLPCKPKG